MTTKLVSIGEAAKKLGVSIDSLRRWDRAHRLHAIRSGPKGHRYYRQSDIDSFLMPGRMQALEWVTSQRGEAPLPEVYCQTRDVFAARLEKLQADLGKITSNDMASLLSAVAGEIGNNSFDHNLGSWPDIPGVFFWYDMRERNIVLADRGQGILTTLKRVKPELTNAGAALKVAFTETISGRLPEARGNGLKFVRSIIVNNPFKLYFQTGDAFLQLSQRDKNVVVQKADKTIRGCFATIGFEGVI